MVPDERTTILARLMEKKGKALEGPYPSMSLVQEIVSDLSKLQKADRPFFRQFVVDLNNELFAHGATLPGLDLAFFELEKTGATDGNAVEDSKNEDDYTVTETDEADWFGTFKRVHDSLGDVLLTLKGYFFLRLHFDSAKPYSPLLIYDHACHHQPVEKRLKGEFGSCETHPVDGLEELIAEKAFPSTNYVAVLLLTTRINDEQGFKKCLERINVILSSFDSVESLAVCPINGTEKKSDLIRSGHLEPLREEISYATTILLTNAEVSFDEEKIIKKLFQHLACPVLEYKVLKGGQSGSRVFEIKPRIGDQSRRYIVKFEPANHKRKTWDEYQRYGQHIEIYSVDGYQQARHDKNTAVECLQYTYASKDAISPSYSFAQIVENDDKEFQFTAENALNMLFEHSAFYHWDSKSVEFGKHKIESLYSDYINQDRFRTKLKEIKDLTNTEIETDPLYINFNNISALEIETNQKTCHGDLHSENFFQDNGGIYLIDFGFTGKRHALVDHAMLECSIKFKHIPKYVEIPELETVENQLISDESFTASFSVSSRRRDLQFYYDLVKIIRLNSTRHFANQNSPLEYLISLFMITCRLMRYDDLNQLYALKSAEILSHRIIEIVNLSVDT